jgi:hypothetical protein
VWGWLRGFYWRDEQMAAALAEGLNADKPGYRAYELGWAALETAERLRHAEELTAGRLLLLRAAVMLLSQATEARSGAAADSPVTLPEGDVFEFACAAVRAAERLRELDGSESGTALLYEQAAGLLAQAHRPQAEDVLPPNAAELSEPDRKRLLAAVAADGTRHLATSSAADREASSKVLERVARDLGRPLRADATRVRKVLRSRWLRVGITAAALLAVPVVVWVQQRTIVGQNLALDRPVTMSSKYALGNVGHDPSALVDGDRRNMGFHTDRGGPQHVTIDLGAIKRIRSVVVYNRTDCCSAKAVPLRIEVSKDGRRYSEVAERSRDFEVWKATFSSTPARYVRLLSSSGDYFHLAEVEVYGDAEAPGP